MKKLHRLLIIFFLIISSSSFSQKLKKTDRAIAENIQSHVSFLSDEKLKGRAAGTDGERIAHDYLISQLQRAGYKPMGDSSTWIQKFLISDGKEIMPACRLSINGKELVLYNDYFPFAFSASKSTEANVAMALAESGVPWFVDLKELLENQAAGGKTDTSLLISARAGRAMAKGATALVIYNNSGLKDLVYNGMDTVATAKIPVIYITSAAVKKHLSKESSLLDVKMNIAMKERFRNGRNVVAYSNNNADSTVVAAAGLGNETGVAELIELSKLLRGKQYRFSNYLLVVYSAEKKGADGFNYFKDHPAINLQKVNYKLNFDTIQEKGLPAVKQSIAEINGLRTHETKTRP